MNKILTLVMLLTASTMMLFAESDKLMRYPTASENEVVFAYAGDLYSVPISGGTAHKLTNSQGIEMYPRFSPDGQTIAYLASYDGNREIYKIARDGGEPTRLTYAMDIGHLPERMGPDKIIMQWTNDGKEILYRGRASSWTSLNARLYTVNKDGGLPEEIPMMWSGYAYFSPDGKKLAYNPVFREYRTWKHYRGGQAGDIHIIDMKTRKIENITNNPAQDIIPMWAGNKIYYLSDRDYTMNIFCYDLTTKKTKKVTKFDKFDVKFPSLGVKHIAFSNGGEIYLLDLATDEYKKINIEIKGDFPEARPEWRNVKDDIVGYDVAPDGKRGVFVARGDVFTVPEKNGRIYNLTKSPGVHDREAAWSPDGKWIAYISDETGDDEVYIIKPDGSDKTKITSYPKNKATYRFSIKWSPDSKKILCSDRFMNLDMIDVATKKSKTIAHSKYYMISDYNWSHDSRFVAFTDYSENEFSVIKIYDIEAGKVHQVTSDYYNSNSPAFTECGKVLVFASGRTFTPKAGNFEYNATMNDMETIFGVTLQDTMPNIFSKFEDDMVEVKEDDAKNKDAKKDKKDEKDKKSKMTIDWKGIQDRAFEFPVKAGGYGGFTSVGSKLYYAKFVDGERGFYCFDIKEKEESKVGDFLGYGITIDQKKIMFAHKGNYYIEPLRAKVKPENKLNLSDMNMLIDHQAEWEQIFDESWRQMKYFFYDKNMHGVDWQEVHDRYKPLVKHAKTRDDLTFIIGEMIGELNCGHAYVGGGDAPKVNEVKIGLLGADIVWDGKGYKLAKIMEGKNWDEATRSPLKTLGLKVKEGDYIVAIDGIEMTKNIHPFAALENKAGKYVEIKYNSKPTMKGATTINVKTLENESKLRYLNWVEANRKYVEEKTNGKVGYVHIPDMGFGNGLIEFFKYYYPQTNKEAMIIDDRYNGGGNVSTIVMERLLRRIVIATNTRGQETVGLKPGGTVCGPMVCLINENSMSDGDLFPYQFKTMGLGKLIGKRSWGGVIGISGSLPFIDGGYLMRPEHANFGADGTWILEGTGQSPDIEVDNNPIDEYNHKDNQLDRGIEEILKEMKTYDGGKIPALPKHPDKSKNMKEYNEKAK